ncbi:DUF1360 domain-containing protein [Alteribacter populi]|uniref:DUF1360 domain-containing protein n=1 Tax=Alteribacter populi TaxID=2011011 RepID=UPI000BBAEBE3|nr:DUF1360 domain-containing protein [Alteribacter populi]
MDFSWFLFLLLSFATFRLTHLIVYDQIMQRLRDHFLNLVDDENEPYYEPKGTGLRYLIGEIISCHWCTAVWSAIFLVLGLWLVPTVFYFVIVVLAVAGLGAIIQAVVVNYLY